MVGFGIIDTIVRLLSPSSATDIEALARSTGKPVAYVGRVPPAGQWHYGVTNPQGGGFGSNYRGNKSEAIRRATETIPHGEYYFVHEEWNSAQERWVPIKVELRRRI